MATKVISKVKKSSPVSSEMQPLNLFEASRKGDVDLMRTLILEKRYDVNEKDYTEFCFTPLHWAARKGHVEACKLLLTNGAYINALTTYGFTPLMWAAKKGHSQVVKLFVRKNAALDIQDESQYTALHHATREGDLASVEILLAAGANMNIHDECGKTAAFYCMSMSFVDLFDTYEEKRASGKRVSSEVFEDGKPITGESSENASSALRANPSLVEDYLLFSDENYLLSNGVLLFALGETAPGERSETGRVIFALRDVPVGQQFCTERGSWLVRVNEEKVKLISAGTTFEVPVPHETFPIEPNGKAIIVDGLSIGSPVTSPLSSPLGSPTTSPLCSRRMPSDVEGNNCNSLSAAMASVSAAAAAAAAVASASLHSGKLSPRARHHQDRPRSPEKSVHVRAEAAEAAFADRRRGESVKSPSNTTISRSRGVGGAKSGADGANKKRSGKNQVAATHQSGKITNTNSPKSPRAVGVSLSRKLSKNARKKMKRRKHLDRQQQRRAQQQRIKQNAEKNADEENTSPSSQDGWEKTDTKGQHRRRQPPANASSNRPPRRVPQKSLPTPPRKNGAS